MKKFIIYVSVVGLAVGVIYLLCKKARSESKPQEKDVSQGGNVVEEMCQAKSESTKAVYEMHSEVGEIMKEAYRNIMEDFVEDFSDEELAKEKEEIKEVIVDSESVSVIKELDSISDELDDLLK